MPAYSDADVTADKEDRKSVTGDMISADGMPISWFCKKLGGFQYQDIYR
ncbi:hypothetical protein PI125_g15025 [Phytophthora idaei]|nr:hypothetical protein PI125_g15025 [Phytophthora idaei]KAG3157516.1 hypothetical protein PI126_g8296 [Phytophthora idaei]